MALNAAKIKNTNSSERAEPLEPGTYPARLVQILSLGLQPQRPYKGEEKAPKYSLYLTYELLDEFMKDKETGEEIEDRPRWISEEIPLNSINSDLAKSTKRYMALDPEMEYGGDWSQLGGTPCMVTVTNSESKERVYENVASISSMRPKEVAKAPDLKNSAKIFDIDEPDMEVFGSLPQWLQDKMKDNLEFEGSALDKALTAPTKRSEGGRGQNAKKATEEAPTGSSDEEEDW